MVLLGPANMGLLLISFLIGLPRKEGAIPDQPQPGPALDRFTGP
jgi:hypothetical protein